MCGSEKRWIYRWKIGSDEKPNSVKKLLFDAKMGYLQEDHNVVLKTSPTTVTVCCGERIRAKIESPHGKIMHMKLYDEGKKLIYITEPGSVVLHDMIDDKSIQLAQLDKPDHIYVDVVKLENNYVVLSRTNDKLMVISLAKKINCLSNLI